MVATVLNFAVGNAPELDVTAAATVVLSPPNDQVDENGDPANAVDSNRIHLVNPSLPGQITVNSFGTAVIEDEFAVAPCTITKKVRFDGNIKLHHNSPYLVLLSGADRVTTQDDVGSYTSTVDGNWKEDSYGSHDAQAVSSSLSGLSDSIAALASDLETRLSELEARVKALEDWRATGFNGVFVVTGYSLTFVDGLLTAKDDA